jgi:hypothetical protein
LDILRCKLPFIGSIDSIGLDFGSKVADAASLAAPDLERCGHRDVLRLVTLIFGRVLRVWANSGQVGFSFGQNAGTVSSIIGVPILTTSGDF